MSCLFFSLWQSWLLSGRGYAKARSVVQVSSETNGSDVAQFWPAQCRRESNRKASLLSSPGDSEPRPTLRPEEGEEKQQIWLLGGLAEKLFTSRFFVIGVSDFYVVTAGFHCPVDSKKPDMTCCVLRGCPTSTVIITADLISSSEDYIYLIPKAHTLLTNPQKQQAMSTKLCWALLGEHGMEQNEDQRKSIQNAVPMTREMGHFQV